MNRRSFLRTLIAAPLLKLVPDLALAPPTHSLTATELSDVGRILKEVYEPFIYEQLMRQSPLMSFMSKELYEFQR